MRRRKKDKVRLSKTILCTNQPHPSRIMSLVVQCKLRVRHEKKREDIEDINDTSEMGERERNQA